MYNPFDLQGKNILITGASSGLGRECAIECSRMGANIILVARNEDRLKATLSELHSGNHLVQVLDVTNYSEIESIVNDSVNSLGKISGFIHSAGIEKSIPLNVMKQEHYEELFRVNVFSGFEFAKILSKNKFYSNNLSLVFISSIMGVVGNPSLIGYSATKGAVISGVKSLALELARKKIRVNSISPAHISDTAMSDASFSKLSTDAQNNIAEMHPLGLGKPQDVAFAAIYLLSDASRWITGTNLIIDGGYSAQ